MLRLSRAGLELTLQPELGGSIAAFRYKDRDLLRPTIAGADHPLQTACFPLVPYANRIAHGRFTFEGTEHRIAPNLAGDASPLHGIGWLSAWDVIDSDEDNATLRLTHRGDDAWPWRFTADQHLSLADDRLNAVLTLVNDDPRPMPTSLGFHPYFLAMPSTRLHFAADGMWKTDDMLLPREFVAANTVADFAKGAPVQYDTLVDNSFGGWNESARIEHGDGTVLRLIGGATPVLHCYVPPGEAFFCAEPVSAMPDAFNQADTVRSLPPGGTTSIEMAIAISRS